MSTRIKVGINGFGRMGKLLLRAIWDVESIEIVHINEPAASAEVAAHLLEFDTVHGHWDHDIAFTGNSISVDGHSISFTQERTIEGVAWDSRGVDMVLECSGVFKSGETLQPYFDSGIRKVLASCPIKDGSALNLVYGVNHHLYRAAEHNIVTAASCTTNCLAPVVKVLQDSIGIRHGSMTTIHDVTNTQVMVDAPHKDLRRARSGLNALIPTTTGSATAITLIYPELKGKLNGHAVRIPLLNASLTDCAFEMERETTVEEINALFAGAAAGELKGILGYETRPLVSTDFTNDPRSSILDAPSTMVVNGTQVKLYAWYDNEWGYVCRMADIARMMGESL
ncbi:ArsJ-associated glyceraldehyde-3-phosphate dehydrogenase [Kiloniella sp. b19]|uniref:ArsJ-associated glyceraldehyde-3-phosphate dehydrogenase n=1 Tax=Kiloniella sp. GXU_MW_B19 TaxID=3141326 RepID=UPI0031DEE7EA